MAIEVFHGATIPRELTSGAMEYLWAKWKTLSGTQSLSLQRLTEESAYPLRDNLIYMISAGDDFVFMYVGQNIQRAGQTNPTGTLLSMSSNPITKDLSEIYRHAARQLAPCFMRFTGARVQNGQIWQGLALPIRIADGLVLLVCHFELVSPQLEVYEYLFRLSPDAMLVARPIGADTGSVVDGWVVMMNDAARDLLNFRAGVGNLRLSQLPQLAGLNFAFRMQSQVSPGSVMQTVSAPAFNVDLIRFSDVFALRLIPRPAARDPEEVVSAPLISPVLAPI